MCRPDGRNAPWPAHRSLRKRPSAPPSPWSIPSLAALHRFPNLNRRVNTLLRFIGVANAALWLGSALFYTLAVEPTFGTSKMLNLLGGTHSTAALLILLERYFLVHYICGFVALVHLFAEWLYLGRPLTRFMLALIIGLLTLGIIGGGQLQPKLERLHVTQHLPDFSKEEKQRAARSYRIWDVVTYLLNLGLVVGTAVYMWRIVYPGENTRFFSLGKIRG